MQDDVSQVMDAVRNAQEIGGKLEVVRRTLDSDFNIGWHGGRQMRVRVMLRVGPSAIDLLAPCHEADQPVHRLVHPFTLERRTVAQFVFNRLGESIERPVMKERRYAPERAERQPREHAASHYQSHETAE